MAAPRGEVTMPMRRGKRGSGRFRSGANRPFGGQLLLELLEGQLQRAQALRLERLHQQLVFAAGLVDVDAAARQHGQAVARLEFPVAVRGAEGHALHLRVALLEGEVVMAAGGQLQAGDFARHPDILEFGIEGRADGGVQLADGENAALRREVEFQGELLHETIVWRVSELMQERLAATTSVLTPGSPTGRCRNLWRRGVAVFPRNPHRAARRGSMPCRCRRLDS